MSSCFRKSAVTSADGVVLDVFEAGDAGKPPLALVNAYAMPVAFLEPLASRLAADHHLITWESRGVPNVEQPFDANRCGVADHSADLGAVLDAKGVQRAKVVAWCSGAQVTMRFAAHYPERVEAVVLLSGAFRTLPGVPLSEFQMAIRVLFRQCAGSLARSGVYSSMLFGGGATTGADSGNAPRSPAPPSAKSNPLASAWGAIPDVVLGMTSRPFKTAEALYRYANTVLAVEKEPGHAWTENIDVPVLLVGGKRDTVVHPETWPAIANRLRRARLAIKPEGDHFMLYQDASVADQIRAFFDTGGEHGAEGAWSRPSG